MKDSDFTRMGANITGAEGGSLCWHDEARDIYVVSKYTGDLCITADDDCSVRVNGKQENLPFKTLFNSNQIEIINRGKKGIIMEPVAHTKTPDLAVKPGEVVEIGLTPDTTFTITGNDSNEVLFNGKPIPTFGTRRSL